MYKAEGCCGMPDRRVRRLSGIAPEPLADPGRTALLLEIGKRDAHIRVADDVARDREVVRRRPGARHDWWITSER